MKPSSLGKQHGLMEKTDSSAFTHKNHLKSNRETVIFTTVLTNNSRSGSSNMTENSATEGVSVRNDIVIMSDFHDKTKVVPVMMNRVPTGNSLWYHQLIQKNF